MRRLLASSLVAASILAAESAGAQPYPPLPPPPPPMLRVAAQPPPPPPAPYSIPWQLRPVLAVSVIRSDTTIASYEDPTTKKGAFTVASMLLASYKVTPDFAPFVRIGVAGTKDAAGLTNLAFGGTYSIKLPGHTRLAIFLGFAVPTGEGGGNQFNPTTAGAVKTGVLARSAMDNAMFAVNDFVMFPGLDFAFIYRGLTIQAEATVLALIRVRGEEVQKDARKANLTTGLHVGYFFAPWLSAGAELRYQRWLSTPAAVAADTSGVTRDNLSVAFGPRFHAQLGKTVWMRPGIAYARGLDKPMAGSNYNIVQIDVPLLF